MSKEINFYIATDLDYYGSEATEVDVDDYIAFARQYLEQRGYDVDITKVSVYPGYGEAVEQHHLREQVWDAWCRS